MGVVTVSSSASRTPLGLSAALSSYRSPLKKPLILAFKVNKTENRGALVAPDEPVLIPVETPKESQKRLRVARNSSKRVKALSTDEVSPCILEVDYNEAAAKLENIYKLSPTTDASDMEDTKRAIRRGRWRRGKIGEGEDKAENKNINNVVRNRRKTPKRLSFNKRIALRKCKDDEMVSSIQKRKDSESEEDIINKLVREYSVSSDLVSLDWKKMKIPPVLPSSEHSWLFKLMQPMKALLQVKVNLHQDLEREPTDSELAEATNMTVVQVRKHLEVGRAARNKLIKGDSHTIRGYGNVVARDWYRELPEAVRQIIDEAGFDIFCRGLSMLMTCRPLLAALVERWWDTTNSFHFSTAEDMTMTPYDFSMLTGIGVGGDPIPFDPDMDEWDAAQLFLLGTQPPFARAGFVRYSWFESHFRTQPALTEEPEMTLEEVDQYARGFIMFLLGTTLFADRVNTVPLCLLSALVDVRRIRRYDWGGAGLATLYGYMSSSSRLSGQLLGGYWRAWELWVYAYFPRLAPVPVEEIPLGVPFSHRFDVRCERRSRESFSFFRRYFDTITAAEITWRPWALLPAGVRDHYEGADETARLRILLEGPVCQAWYLGERFLRQTLGLPEQIVPGPPPAHMRHTERFSLEHMGEYTVSWGAERHRGEGDYAEYVRTYIMRPLSGGQRTRRERPAVPAARTGAGAGAGASRGARVHGRGGAQRGRGASWPALPTLLTYRGQSGATYQIPFAPPPAGHELADVPDLPSASSEYTQQSLELNASMMGMLQRTFDILALYGIPPPFQIPPVGDAPAGPSVPTRGGRGDTARPRTKGGRTHVGSNSRAPVPDDDDDESEPEAEAESSEEEIGDGSDSGSDDGADDAFGLVPRKRERTDPQV